MAMCVWRASARCSEWPGKVWELLMFGFKQNPQAMFWGVLLPKLTRTASKMDTYPIKHVLKVFQLLPFETCYFNCGLNHVTTLKGLRFLGDTANELGPGT